MSFPISLTPAPGRRTSLVGTPARLADTSVIGAALQGMTDEGLRQFQRAELSSIRESEQIGRLRLQEVEREVLLEERNALSLARGAGLRILNDAMKAALSQQNSRLVLSSYEESVGEQLRQFGDLLPQPHREQFDIAMMGAMLQDQSALDVRRQQLILGEAQASLLEETSQALQRAAGSTPTQADAEKDLFELNPHLQDLPPEQRAAALERFRQGFDQETANHLFRTKQFDALILALDDPERMPDLSRAQREGARQEAFDERSAETLSSYYVRHDLWKIRGVPVQFEEEIARIENDPRLNAKDQANALQSLKTSANEGGGKRRAREDAMLAKIFGLVPLDRPPAEELSKEVLWSAGNAKARGEAWERENPGKKFLQHLGPDDLDALRAAVVDGRLSDDDFTLISDVPVTMEDAVKIARENGWLAVDFANRLANELYFGDDNELSFTTAADSLITLRSHFGDDKAWKRQFRASPGITDILDVYQEARFGKAPVGLIMRPDPDNEGAFILEDATGSVGPRSSTAAYLQTRRIIERANNRDQQAALKVGEAARVEMGFMARNNPDETIDAMNSLAGPFFHEDDPALNQHQLAVTEIAVESLIQGAPETSPDNLWGKAAAVYVSENNLGRMDLNQYTGFEGLQSGNIGRFPLSAFDDFGGANEMGASRTIDGVQTTYTGVPYRNSGLLDFLGLFDESAGVSLTHRQRQGVKLEIFKKVRATTAEVTAELLLDDEWLQGKVPSGPALGLLSPEALASTMVTAALTGRSPEFNGYGGVRQIVREVAARNDFTEEAVWQVFNEVMNPEQPFKVSDPFEILYQADELSQNPTPAERENGWDVLAETNPKYKMQIVYRNGANPKNMVIPGTNTQARVEFFHDPANPFLKTTDQFIKRENQVARIQRVEEDRVRVIEPTPNERAMTSGWIDDDFLTLMAAGTLPEEGFRALMDSGDPDGWNFVRKELRATAHEVRKHMWLSGLGSFDNMRPIQKREVISQVFLDPEMTPEGLTSLVREVKGI